LTLLLALAVCMLGLTAGGAQGALIINYPSFSPAPELQLNESAALVGSSLRLTPAETFKSGSAFSTKKISTTESFETEFELRMDESNTIGPGTLGFPADGIAFVLQSQSETALGTKGLGYEGIQPSVAVEFDIFRNPYDPNVPNVSLLENGNLKKHYETSDTPLSFPLYGDTAVLAWIVYEATKKELSVYAVPWPLNTPEPEKPEKSLFTYNEIDLSKVFPSALEAFAGFTAGTGAGDAVQEVCGWQLASGTLGGMKLGAANCSVLTPAPAPTQGQAAAPAASAHASTTRVACSLVISTASNTCTATVTDTATAGASNPTGAVAFASGNGGVFPAGSSCNLAPVSGLTSTSSCSAEFLPPRKAAPSPSLTASYPGDGGHSASSGVSAYVPAEALSKDITFSTRATLSATGGQIEVPVLCHFACGVVGELTSGSSFSAETAAKRVPLGKGSLRLGKPGKGVLRVTLNPKARRALRKASGRAVKGILKATTRTASGTVVKVDRKTVTIRPHPGGTKAKHH
jgi:hypothetical protein